MRVTAKADYAVRAALALATASQQEPAKPAAVADAQRIPPHFLEIILGELRREGLVESGPGTDGGHWLGRPAHEITVAEIVRAVEGPLGSVRGEPPEELRYDGGAEHLQQVWVALRTNIRLVLDHVTLADLASGDLPDDVVALTHHPDFWRAE